MTSYRLPPGLPDDVREWCEAKPEIARLMVRAHVERWPAQRLLDALRGSDYYQEMIALEEAWRRESEADLRRLLEVPPRTRPDLDPIRAYMIGLLGGILMTAGFVLTAWVSVWFLPLVFAGPASTRLARWLDTRGYA